MAEDFPAAHSMDAHWFAVDEDGFIAVFDSGEEAAVPTFVSGQDEADELIDRVLLNAPGLIWMHGDIRGCHAMVKAAQTIWSLDMFLDATLATPAIVDRFSLSTEPSNFQIEGGRVVTHVRVQSLSARLFEELHGARFCLGCMDLYAYPQRPDVGLFHYQADTYGNPPYRRTSSPRKPFQVNDLPKPLLLAAQARLLPGVRFREEQVVQPAEVTPCHFWYDTNDYLRKDGATRVPVPKNAPPSEAQAPPVPGPHSQQQWRRQRSPRSLAELLQPKRWWQFWK